MSECKEPTKKQLLWDIRQMLYKLTNKDEVINTNNQLVKLLEDRINALEQRVAYLESTSKPFFPRNPYPPDIWYTQQDPTPWLPKVMGDSKTGDIQKDPSEIMSNTVPGTFNIDSKGNVIAQHISKKFNKKDE